MNILEINQILISSTNNLRCEDQFNDKTGEENIYKAYLNMGILPNRKVLEVPYEQVITPDVIIINVGGNDYSAVINPLNGFAKQEKIQEFKDQVAAFVLKLRADAPNAHIIWTMT